MTNKLESPMVPSKDTEFKITSTLVMQQLQEETQQIQEGKTESEVCQQQSTTTANQPQPSQTISQQAPTTANPIPDRPSRTPTSPTAGSRHRNQRPAQRQQHTLPTQGQGITNITWEQMAAVDTLQILHKNIVTMDIHAHMV